jgi:TolB protein
MLLTLALLPALIQAPASQEPVAPPPQAGLAPAEALRFDDEVRFGAIRRLTTEGENAEGYFSWGGKRITYQATIGGYPCDQIYELDLLSGARRLISTGTGRTTCSFYMPGDSAIVFASTHAADDSCLPPPDMSRGYVWKIYPQYDLYVRDLETWELKPLAPAEGYDAEAVVSPDGGRIVFTSRRNGDLDLYTMNTDGSDLKQVTDRLGYDGGAFFSADSKKLVWRAYYPETAEEKAKYQALLDDHSIEPMALQVYVMDADGGNKVQVTDNGAANFGPYFHPDGEHIIYSSNQASRSGRDFDLFLIRVDGTGNERVTFCPSFDGFPMFSADGRNLIFASNRANKNPRDTNLFMAEWLPLAQPAQPAGR